MAWHWITKNCSHKFLSEFAEPYIVKYLQKFATIVVKKIRVGDTIGTQVPKTFSLPNYCCQGYLLVDVSKILETWDKLLHIK